jgi:ATP-dependent Lon protease
MTPADDSPHDMTPADDTPIDMTAAAVPHDIMPILPLRNIVFFPGQMMPLFVGRPSSVRLIEEAYRTQTPVLVLTQKDSSIDLPTLSDLYGIGTVIRVAKIYTMPDGSKSIVVQGQHRAQVQRLTQEEPYLAATVQRLSDDDLGTDAEEIGAMLVNIRGLYKQLSDLVPDFNPEHLNMIMNTDDPNTFGYLVSALVNQPVPEKQELLEVHTLRERLSKVTVALTGVIQRQELSQKIQSEVQDSINKTQREYFLREQMRAIKKELGEDNDRLELDEIRTKMEEANMPAEVKAVVEKELNRLNMMNPASAEYTVARTYLDWLLDMPWSHSTDDNLDIAAVRTKLDEDHYGLDKVKKRILEYLAVRKLKNDMRGPILCFVGPPGVGKTSLGRSIAEAMGRNYVRMSLGGVHDEAEIRGHRRTYIGALPGRVIQSIRKSGSNNPVVVLDEIDKVGTDFRGDPTSALLEVLDPEQNAHFSDHYLEVPFDLSKVLFIATANLLEPIQPALRDRMEIIEIPSYILDEKVHIARRHLLPKQIAEHGLTPEQLEMGDDTLAAIVDRYTREAGVRALERRIADVCRGVARGVAEGTVAHADITPDDLPGYITSRRFHPEIAERVCTPGIATGLAWTPVGGDILFIEASKMKGKGMLTITGQVRDVMKESVQAAITWIASQATDLGIDPDFRHQVDIHVHVPAGAVPKDGPSAGVTMLAAITSLLTGRLVRNDLAMTGEITLRGAVLPIGGVKEKVLAAHRAGIKTVILPQKNEDDIAEIPESVRKELTIHLVSTMHEILDLALVSGEAPCEPKKTRRGTKKHLEPGAEKS